MGSDDRDFVRDAATGEGVGSVSEKPVMEKPHLVSLTEAKDLLRSSSEPETRLQRAKPFPLPQFDVMVAPLASVNVYDKLFGSADEVFKGNVTGESVRENVDRTLVKMMMQGCIVMPVVDEEFLDLLWENHPQEFMALMAFCQHMTIEAPQEAIYRRLGRLDTEAQELFCSALSASTSTPMRS